jgi:hypothetical protein
VRVKKKGGERDGWVMLLVEEEKIKKRGGESGVGLVGKVKLRVPR